MSAEPREQFPRRCGARSSCAIDIAKHRGVIDHPVGVKPITFDIGPKADRPISTI